MKRASSTAIRTVGPKSALPDSATMKTPSIRHLRLAFLLALCCTIVAPFARGEMSPDALRTAEDKIRSLTRDAAPAVVSLIPSGDSRGYATGSGVVVSPDGLVLTAAHVAVEMGRKVTVIFPDGERAEAEVLGMDFTRDAAMVRIVEPGPYPFVEVGDSKTLAENDWCVALGHPGGFEAGRPPPVRLGRIVALERDEFLISDSVLIGGDSGGPLFDLEARVIGIHSNIGYQLSENRHVPIAVFQENWSRLNSGHRFGGIHEGGFLDNPYRPMIGAQLENAGGGGGARIIATFDNSPAEKAGLEPGDVVIRVKESTVTDVAGLQREIGSCKAGEIVPFVIEREGKEQTVKLELTEARKLDLPPRPRRTPSKEESAPPKRSTGLDTEEDASERKEEFHRRMRDALENHDTERDWGEFRELGRPSELGKWLREFAQSLTGEERVHWLEMLAGPTPVKPESYDPDAPVAVSEPFFRDVLDAFRPSVAEAAAATHPVFLGSEWKSLCTVVHPDGFAVAKASELEERNNQALNVLVRKGTLVPATVVETFPELDLVLLELEHEAPLTAVSWSSQPTPGAGSLIAAAGSGPDAIAIGVVSVPERVLSGEKKGFLGIGTAAHPKGVRVTVVMPRSAAAQAGFRPGDIITHVAGSATGTPEKLIAAISGTAPGESIELRFRRGKEDLKREVELGNRAEYANDRRSPHGKMNRFGTEVSKRASGYERVVQTDLPIEPRQCGGPVVDLDGNVIGINIARAGRILTYALPADMVRDAVSPEIAKRVEMRETVKATDRAPAG